MNRTIEQITEHYEIEKELAAKLKQSTKEERKYLYTSVYNELFKRVSHHPQLTNKKSVLETRNLVSSQLSFLRNFLRKDSVFVEVGPGDCSLSLAVAEITSKVYAVDVSTEISKNEKQPKNFQLIISDGTSIAVPQNANIVYSNQLMEHLHPDDAKEQLINIINILSEGGKYICITPNRINGPHDVSKYFDKEASGFHLREYTFKELRKMFKDVGFKTVRGYWGTKGVFIKIPFIIISFFESLLSILPRSIRMIKMFSPFLFIRIVGIK